MKNTRYTTKKKPYNTYNYYSGYTRRNTVRKEVENVLKYKAELKNYDVAATGVEIDDNGLIVPLTNIGQGDTSITREGNKISVKSVQMQLVVTKDADRDDAFRLIVFQYFRPVPGSNPASTDLMVTGGSFYSMVLANTASFKVLYNCIFPVMTVENPSIVIQEFRKIIKYNQVHFTGTTANNWSQNPIFAYMISTSPNGGTDKVVANYAFRVRFNDF